MIRESIDTSCGLCEPLLQKNGSTQQIDDDNNGIKVGKDQRNDGRAAIFTKKTVVAAASHLRHPNDYVRNGNDDSLSYDTPTATWPIDKQEMSCKII